MHRIESSIFLLYNNIIVLYRIFILFFYYLMKILTIMVRLL